MLVNTGCSLKAANVIGETNSVARDVIITRTKAPRRLSSRTNSQLL
jgi:hypothetical protein